MVRLSKIYLVLLGLIFLSTACNTPTSELPPLPTQAVAAAVPSVAPSPTQSATLPPTRDLTPAEATSPPPTNVPETATPRPTETPGPASIKITEPMGPLELPMGSTLALRGLTQLHANQVISITLQAQNGRLLTETVALVEDNFWQASLRIPEFVSGAATLTAAITDDSQSILAAETLPATILLDKTVSNRYLEILRPAAETAVVGGFNLFADGNAENPVGGRINMAVYTDDCQRRLSSQGYELRGSGYWQAFLVLPPDIVGPACAIIWFGTPGEESWREHQMPITLLPADDITANGVVVGFPPPDSLVTAGQDLFLHGTAQNAQIAPVRVSILLENGRIISESDVETDFWGYWQQTIFLPVDISGPAQITVTVGESGDPFFAQATTNITIEEPPPTPVP